MKHTRLKTLLTLTLAASLTAACAVYAAADTGSPVIDTTKKASLTLVKIRENTSTTYETYGKAADSGIITGTGMKGIKFGILKVADITAVTGDGEIGVYFSNPDTAFMSLLSAQGITPTATSVAGTSYYTAEAMYDALNAMNSVTGTTPGEVLVNNFVKNDSGTVHMSATDASGSSTVTGLPLGLYLVAEEDYSSYVPASDPTGLGLTEAIHNPSSPFLVSLPMTDPGSTGTAFEWLYDVTVYPKNQTVTIPKYIVSEADGRTLVQSEDLEIGETVRQVIVSDAPAVQALYEDATNRQYESYVVSDAMEAGLSFSSLVSVKLGNRVANPTDLDDFRNFTDLESGKDYEIYKGTEGDEKLTSLNAAGTKTFRVVLLERGIQYLNSLQNAGQVVVVFDSLVTRDAEDGNAAANTNKPTLTAKNKNTLSYTVSGNEPRVYSYRVVLSKKGVENPTRVVFSVKRNNSTLNFVKESAGLYHLYDNDLDASQNVRKYTDISPAGDGTLTIRGLDADSYEFTEKATESGYELLKSAFTVTLTAADPVDGNLAGAVISTPDGSAEIPVEDGVCSFSVENMKSLILRTGGRGTRMIYLGGLAAVLGAALLLILRKRGRE